MKTLLLVGAGHTHAQVLLEFVQRGAKDVHIVLVSPFHQAPYSGMVPGWLAGHYSWEECCIDFSGLCQRAGARLVASQAEGIDTARSELILQDGSRLRYDWLSLNIGATLTPPESPDITVLPMRPLADLQVRWNALLDAVGRLETGACYRIVMIGGGAAGVESMLAARHRLTRLAPTVHFQFTLATQDEQIVPDMAPGAARRLYRHLAAQGITVASHFSATHIHQEKIIGNDGDGLPADVALWATGAQAHAWPEAAGLATDEQGFIRIDSKLRSISQENIFASGDCASWVRPLPKAGVYAVRMGPLLAHNLLAAISGMALHDYTPQRRYLTLIGTGGLHAVAAWGRVAWQGKWVWYWKQRIDRRFIGRYRHG